MRILNIADLQQSLRKEYNTLYPNETTPEYVESPPAGSKEYLDIIGDEEQTNEEDRVYVDEIGIDQ